MGYQIANTGEENNMRGLRGLGDFSFDDINFTGLVSALSPAVSAVSTIYNDITGQMAAAGTPAASAPKAPVAPVAPKAPTAAASASSGLSFSSPIVLAGLGLAAVLLLKRR